MKTTATGFAGALVDFSGLSAWDMDKDAAIRAAHPTMRLATEEDGQGQSVKIVVRGVNVVTWMVAQ